MASTLSADTKDALAREMPSAPHCRAALLDGLLLYGARDDVFVTGRNAVARLFRSLLKDRSGAAIPTLRGVTQRVRVPEGMGAPSGKPAQKCDRAHEARAAFLAAGSLAAGARGYHLEFVVADRGHADRLILMLRTLGHVPKQMIRKGRIVLYYKDFDTIEDILTGIGAFGAVLKLEDVRAMRETKNRIHRLVNTEAANLDRAAEAAAGQRDTIAYLESAYGLANLSPALRETADLRLEYPEETLAELGRRCSPPIGKPTMNSRFAALAALARRLKEPRRRSR